MTTLLKFLLASHVVLGLLGVAAFYAVWMQLLKQKVSVRFTKISSIWGALFLVLSWVTGGYYYATYYGAAVRSVIRAGQYPWAHSVFMEAKEHIFLFLPFLGIVLAIVLVAVGEQINSKPVLKKELALLAGVISVLGIIITLSGAIISGAVR
ncbi:MAG: hypothetical protein U1C57_00370 [Candidatus Doudnabacteria bacterium]|nr:hypothetical protein [Candidatus Doudnabacteria bacterium]